MVTPKARTADVVVLEGQATYTDRVKGEAMLPWGVEEAKLCV